MDFWVTDAVGKRAHDEDLNTCGIISTGLRRNNGVGLAAYRFEVFVGNTDGKPDKMSTKTVATIYISG